MRTEVLEGALVSVPASMGALQKNGETILAVGTLLGMSAKLTRRR